MGEGWETRRRRDRGHDHAVIRLGFAGQVRQLIVDTAHFKYNASAAIEAWACADDRCLPPDSAAWEPLLARDPAAARHPPRAPGGFAPARWRAASGSTRSPTAACPGSG